MADLEYTVQDGIGTILLNRPHRKNAFTMQMIDQWAEALRSARTDPAVRVVAVTGAGDAFCAGIDLDVFAAEAAGASLGSKITRPLRDNPMTPEAASATSGRGSLTDTARRR